MKEGGNNRRVKPGGAVRVSWVQATWHARESRVSWSQKGDLHLA
jgi:hypothetical protein